MVLTPCGRTRADRHMCPGLGVAWAINRLSLLSAATYHTGRVSFFLEVCLCSRPACSGASLQPVGLQALPTVERSERSARSVGRLSRLSQFNVVCFDPDRTSCVPRRGRGNIILLNPGRELETRRATRVTGTVNYPSVSDCASASGRVDAGALTIFRIVPLIGRAFGGERRFMSHKLTPDARSLCLYNR